MGVSAEDEVSEAVFYQAFIPKRLDEVMHYERDHDKLQAAGAGQKVCVDCSRGGRSGRAAQGGSRDSYGWRESQANL